MAAVFVLIVNDFQDFKIRILIVGMVCGLDFGYPIAILILFDFAKAIAFFVYNEQSRYVFFIVKLSLYYS